MNELDRIFDQINKPAVVRKTANAKKSPSQIVAEFQKSLDALTESSGMKRVVIPVKKSAAKPQRVRIEKLDPITKRDTAGSDPLGSENLGTRSTRATGSVKKAERQVDLYSGFASRGRMTGEYE